MNSHCHADPKCREPASAECQNCEKPVCVKHQVCRAGLVFCSSACADVYETPLYTYPE